MIVDLPDTTTSAVGARLVSLREEHGAMALSRVLTLLISVNERALEQAVATAVASSHMHPCRMVVLVPGRRRADRLDAQIRVGGDAGASEVVVLRLHGSLAAQQAAVATPLLLADCPVVGWWPGRAPADAARDPLGALCRRRITDSAAGSSAARELERRAAGYRPGDTDLAWSRITRWRGVLAAALDQPPFDRITGGVVTGGADSPSTDLLAGWLAHALRIPVMRARTPSGTGLISVRLERPSGDLDLVRPDGLIATLTHPLQPVRRIAMARRSDAECLADELRHLDADEIYHAALTRGIPRLVARRATASSLVRAGRAPSPDDARRLARRAGRATRRTSADMVRVHDGEVVPVEPAAGAVAERAARQKRIGRRIDPGPGS